MKEPKQSKLEKLFISIGSNIDPITNIADALSQLKREFSHIDVSNYYLSPAVVGESENQRQPNYINTAILTKSNFDPYDIKYNILRKIEERLNRVRTEDKFAPRTIDLDIAIYGSLVINNEDLIVPDPDILEYAHVLYPLCDLDPEFIHPTELKSLNTLKNNLSNTNISVYNV